MENETFSEIVEKMIDLYVLKITLLFFNSQISLIFLIVEIYGQRTKIQRKARRRLDQDHPLT